MEGGHHFVSRRIKRGREGRVGFRTKPAPRRECPRLRVGTPSGLTIWTVYAAAGEADGVFREGIPSRPLGV